MKAATSYDRVYAVVRRVPRGRVATYGQVARLAGLVNGARQAGYALHALRPHTAVPWHRVLNAAGRISLGDVAGSVTQRLLLEREGVRFDATGRVDLSRFQWKARARQGD
jgi:methylated-DNA-protein-cysteine methyltransferase-like protein